MNNQSVKYRDFALLALFAAIVLLLGFTPLGYIPLPFIKMTIIHIPVILGSIILGPKKGAALGFLFGLTSLISNTITPALTSFTFSPFIPLPGAASGTPLALFVCFIPRILVGILPAFVFRGMQALISRQKRVKVSGTSNVVSLAVAGVVGSFTNTVFVMGLIFLLFRDAYAAVRAIDVDAVLGVILGVVGFNGVLEAIGAGILVAAIGKALLKLLEKSRS